jgi:hypothetical protein
MISLSLLLFVVLGAFTFVESVTGATCAVNHQCQNGATCVDTPPFDTYVCICTPQWTGEICDYPVDATGVTTTAGTVTTTLVPSSGETPCPTNPCLNGAACYLLAGGGFICTCAAGYTGLLCDVQAVSIQNQCQSNLCQNGATCVGTPYFDTYVCFCTPQWAGDFCDYPVDATGVTTTAGTVATTSAPSSSETPCPTNPCLNGAACYLLAGAGFVCTCAAGYTGPLCDVQAVSIQNQCQSSPCQNGGICYLTLTGFACACINGYSGTYCDINLAATNPCFNNPCLNSGTCQLVSSNTYRCVCQNDYLGVRCERRIGDPNPCYNGGICVSTTNS